MSADASVTFDWADDTYKFRLAYGEIRELQEKNGSPGIPSSKVGPRKLYMRILAGEWFADDLRETIRLGLIGGGMQPPKALDLVRRYVEGRPAFESIEPAVRILAAFLTGVPDDPVGKTTAEEAKTETTTAPNVSPSPQSTH